MVSMSSSGHRRDKSPIRSSKKDAFNVRLGSFTVSIKMLTLEGFPVGGIKLVATDPLADKDALASKVLAIMVAGKGTFTVKTIVATLRAEGLAKEPRAISTAVSQALQILKRRRLVASGGHLWTASICAANERGRM
jgi:hypothetical protein